MTTSSASLAKQDFPRHPQSEQLLAWVRNAVEALNASDPQPLRRDVRTQALQALETRGFPSRKDEDWQYTPLNDVLKADYATPAAGSIDASQIEALRPPFAASVQVLVDGVWQPDLSDGLPKGVTLASIEQVDELTLKRWQQLATVERDAFELMNLALLERGVQLSATGMVDLPVVLLHLYTQSNGIAAPRHLLRIESQAQLSLIEIHATLQDGAALSVPVMETDVASGGILRHVKLQQVSDQAFHMAHHFLRQQAGSDSASMYAALGGAVSRHMTHACLLGENANADINSAGLATGTQVMDSRTYTGHDVPNCTSRQLHKLVVDDAARGVFDGMIRVARGAQKTDGLMDNKNLLLGPKAKVDAKPRLEIYADDVKCSHGSATGQLDRDQVFYLRARGISEADARLLITTAFLTEPVESISNDAVRHWLHDLLAAKLNP